ncbi:hypothetical protein [Nonomuraea zeae]|uniref:Uncharacterized protein n=1 Tax=Nonomuraea zeae TaxID=1642303 RepID=A0A5S4FTE2_9ACTN|nr:hypothetical protein [Nonomuraea zeae]TMR13046.1 hypothetical protein ETD85_57875 [Nonomuraea zeae]
MATLHLTRPDAVFCGNGGVPTGLVPARTPAWQDARDRAAPADPLRWPTVTRHAATGPHAVLTGEETS